MEINIEETRQFNNIMTDILDSLFQENSSNHILNMIDNFFDEHQLDLALQESFEEHNTLVKNNNISLKTEPLNIVENTTTMCCICLDTVKDTDTAFKCPKCDDIVHYDCMNEWIKMNNSCPICRQEIDVVHNRFDVWVDEKLNL